MDNIDYGYVRVSIKDQNIIRQTIALEKFGIAQEHTFVDKQSGKDFDRPEYKNLIRKLKKGDTVVVKSIDRLGRNYEEIIEQWRVIIKEKQAAIVVLDTRQGRDLTGTLILDIVLQLLSYVAQTERKFIRRRQAEGIAAALEKGVQFGVRPKRKPPEYEVCRAAWLQGEMTSREADEILHISHKTFLRWVHGGNQADKRAVALLQAQQSAIRIGAR